MIVLIQVVNGGTLIPPSVEADTSFTVCAGGCMLQSSFWIRLVIAILILVLALFSGMIGQYFQERSIRKNTEERQRQKKLDRQNNIGRRIYNRLKPMENGEFVVDDEQNEPNRNGKGFIISIRKWTGEFRFTSLYILIDMFSQNAENFRPIMVRRGNQEPDYHWKNFDEIWRAEDEAVEELIRSIEDWLVTKYGAVIPVRK